MCVWTLGAPVFVGFAAQCGKHLLKGFQVQFGVGMEQPAH